VYESPASVALHAAHAELQQFVVSRDVHRLMAELAGKYSDLVEAGQWHTPAREALDAIVRTIQVTVTGDVRMKFHKGECRVVGRRTAPRAVAAGAVQGAAR
jgi:argininosuccinate synthase